MEFLEKLFEYEYFTVILFTVMGILVFLFILILILGKKDVKKNKKNEEKLMDTVVIPPVGVEAPSLVASQESAPASVETPVVESEPVEEHEEFLIQESYVKPAFDPFAKDKLKIEPLGSNFDADFESPSISTPVVSSENIEVKEPVIEAPITADVFDTPIVSENVEIKVEDQNSVSNEFAALAASLGPVAEAMVESSKKDVDPVVEERTMPVIEPVEVFTKEPIKNEQFSSVYVNNPVDVVESEVELPKTLPVNDSVVTPVVENMPVIDMSAFDVKPLDETPSSPVLPPVQSSSPFPGLEPEVYDIKIDN